MKRIESPRVLGRSARTSTIWAVAATWCIFVPLGRAINAITATNWEGTGVVPDVRSDRERAFEIALERARIAADSHRPRR
jgi:hypothetical protein